MQQPERMLDRVRDQLKSEGARACVEIAKAILENPSAWVIKGDNIDAAHEARQWVSLAMAVEKANADAIIADSQKKLDAKFDAREKAAELAAKRGFRVVEKDAI